MKIGITGHQRLDDPAAWPWVERYISEAVDKLRPPLVAVSSLAIGADQMLARIVLQKGGKIHAVLPFADYERTLRPEDVPAYRELLRSSHVEVLHVIGNDEDAYLQAGRRVVELAEVVLAVWDGKPAQGKGGTADIVTYALEKGVPLIQINPMTRSVVNR